MNSVATATILQIDPQSFESGIAGAPVARLSGLTVAEPAFPHALAQAVTSWIETGVWLVSCRLPAGQDGLRETLIAAGFLPIETLVTFHQAARPPARSVHGIALAAADDAEACVDLALAAFTFDRLHRDARVPGAVADTIRAAWVRNDLNGRAAAPLVARRDGRVVGFNLCLLRGRTAVIDLIAVDSEHRGQGLGADLIEAAFGHFGETVDGIRVGTQAENPASIRLYEKTGFNVETRETTLHWVNPGVTPDLGG